MTGGTSETFQGMARKVAVVDDDADGRSALTSLLRACGFEAEAFDGARAFLGEADDAYSCVVSDVQMPGMTGLQLAEALKAETPTLPVILMTAYPEEVGRRLAERLGVAHYIEKPFDPDDLLARLKAILGAGASD